MLFPTSIILAGVTFLGTVVEAQRPASVRVTAYSASKRCRGAQSSTTVAPGSGCQPFASGANSYQVNRDSETCVLITYSDAACKARVSRRELEDSEGDPTEHCEGLPQKAQSFKIKCGVDDHGGDDKLLLSRIARHGRDDDHHDDHGHHRGEDHHQGHHEHHGHEDHHCRHRGDDGRCRHHGDDDHGHHGDDDHGHHGDDDHGHHGDDDHGHHGDDDHGHHGDDNHGHHGDDDHGHHGDDDHGHHGDDDYGHHGGDDHGGHGGSGPDRV